MSKTRVCVICTTYSKDKYFNPPKHVQTLLTQYGDVSTWKSHLWERLQLWYAIRSKVEKLVCRKIFLACVCWVESYKSVQHIPPYTCLFYRVLDIWNRFSSAIIQKRHNISFKKSTIIDYCRFTMWCKHVIEASSKLKLPKHKVSLMYPLPNKRQNII